MQNLVAESDVMAVLKSSTAEQHQAVENLMPFFREQFSLQDYTRTLAAFLGFFEPVEQALRESADWSDVGIDIHDRSRAHLLRNDLIALGLSASQIASLPRSTSMPPIHNLESALGCLYVLEGSTLGGQVIGRELARRFGYRRILWRLILSEPRFTRRRNVEGILRGRPQSYPATRLPTLGC